MEKIRAYAAQSEGSILKPYEFQAKALKPNDVLIKISHCGICHSDLHLIDNDWDVTQYPLVPGHEIVGTVVEKGDLVEHLEIAARVGVGWQCEACLQCDLCLQGHENNCPEQKATCVDQNGGYATHIVTDSHFVFTLPDSLSSAETAPLFCGGATVYSPIRQYITRPNMRVGIVGLGGLGHMAVKFAKTFNAEITLFSSTAEKEEEGRKLGADNFVSSIEPPINKLSNYFDLILVTVHAELEWSKYLDMLRTFGTLCFVGVVSAPITISAFPLLVGRKRIVGSNIASRAEITEMLEVAERFHIGATIEKYAFDEVNTAIKNVRDNKVRYRAVLEID
jgi:alcohol/geraniol dehydrogenase (NADP+)